MAGRLSSITKTLGIAIKLLVIVVLVVIVFFVYTTCSGGIHKIDKTLPDVTTAPYQVWTATTTYYCDRAQKNADGSVTMFNWYMREGKKGQWVKHPESFTIMPVLRPAISQRKP